jgi:hypothetical protein
VPTAIYVDRQKVSQGAFSDIDDRHNLTDIDGGTQEWTEGDLIITGRRLPSVPRLHVTVAPASLR